MYLFILFINTITKLKHSKNFHKAVFETSYVADFERLKDWKKEIINSTVRNKEAIKKASLLNVFMILISHLITRLRKNIFKVIQINYIFSV